MLKETGAEVNKRVAVAPQKGERVKRQNNGAKGAGTGYSQKE